jgi:alanine racemase
MTAPQAHASVDLDAYRSNLLAVAACAPTAMTLAVVKANAYGHGMVHMARAARGAGVPWLGVATLDEALALRAAGDTGHIVCWLASPGAPWAQAVEAGIDVTASSAEQLAEIVAAAPSRPRVHLKVDTGLSRNGARGPQWTELVQAASAAQRAGDIEVTGTWSHFACADEPDHPANDEQERVFRDAVAEMEAHGLEPGIRHMANSAAALTRPSAHFDMVRIGIAAYGIAPDPALHHAVELKPVMTLQARIAQVKTVPAGSSVSYGHTWTTPVQTRLAVVPIGYGDGIAIAASGKAQVWVNGRRVPVVGRICMDQFVLDLGDVAAERGDTAILFGSGALGEPTAQDWAQASGTIAYEVVTRLGDRITRTYQGPR